MASSISNFGEDKTQLPVILPSILQSVLIKIGGGRALKSLVFTIPCLNDPKFYFIFAREMIAFIQKVLNQKYKSHKYKIYNEKNYNDFIVVVCCCYDNDGTI